MGNIDTSRIIVRKPELSEAKFIARLDQDRRQVIGESAEYPDLLQLWEQRLKSTEYITNIALFERALYVGYISINSVDRETVPELYAKESFDLKYYVSDKLTAKLGNFAIPTVQIEKPTNLTLTA